jgi:hypothetical protein
VLLISYGVELLELLLDEFDELDELEEELVLTLFEE